jgi:hypothetical protein
MAAAVPTSRVGLGRLEDQESADSARGGGTRRGLVAVEATNAMRVKESSCAARMTGADSRTRVRCTR